MAGQQAAAVGLGRASLATTEELTAAGDRAWDRVGGAKAHTAYLKERSRTLLAASHQRVAAADHRAGVEAMPRRVPAPPRQPGANVGHCGAATMEATTAWPQARPAPPVPHREAMGTDLTEP